MMTVIANLASSVGAFMMVLIILGLIVLAFLFLRRWYRVASANEALVISGGRRAKPQVIVAGGKFVTPFQKCVTFPLNVMTIRSDEQETQSNSMVPIIVQWTAQLRADTTNEETLEQAVIGFLGASEGDIRDSLKQTLDGEVRAVLGLMTPEDVVRNKADLSTKVSENVNDRMKELGFILISLNIAEVTDRNNHYFNLGALEREGRRREAENVRAEAEQSIAETKAATEKEARFAELVKEEEVAERQRDVDLKRAGYKAEVDQAQTAAAYAGQLQEQERLTELATRQGAVAVERERQNQAAAQARREVVTTEAETARQKLRIEAEAQKEKVEIDASADGERGKIEAEAQAAIAQRKASGEAEAARERAMGDADAIKTRAEAEAEQIRKTGQANADAEEALGLARAAATLAEGQAKAEAERLMAEALAANDAVNLQVTLAEIESRTRIEVSTAIATAVAEVGTNTTIIDMGGGYGSSGPDGGGGGGDLLNRFLGNLPETLKRLDVKSEALSGKPISEAINSLAAALMNAEPVLESKDAPPAKLVTVTPDATEDNLDENEDDLLESPFDDAEAVLADELAEEPAEEAVEIALDAVEAEAAPEAVAVPAAAPAIPEAVSADEAPATEAPTDETTTPLVDAGLPGTPADAVDAAAGDGWRPPFDGSMPPATIVSLVPAATSYTVDTEPIEAEAAVPEAAMPEAAPPQAEAPAPDPQTLVTEASLDESTLAEVPAIEGEIAEFFELSPVEVAEVAEVVSIVASSVGVSEEELYDLSGYVTTTIRQMRQEGKAVNPRSIARELLSSSPDGKVRVRDLVAAARRLRVARQDSSSSQQNRKAS